MNISFDFDEPPSVHEKVYRVERRASAARQIVVPRALHERLEADEEPADVRRTDAARNRRRRMLVEWMQHQVVHQVEVEVVDRR